MAGPVFVGLKAAAPGSFYCSSCQWQTLGPDLGEEKHPAESSGLLAGKGGGWGGEGFESPSGVYLCFFFSFFFFFFVLLVQCSMKRDEGRGDRRAVEGCGGRRGIPPMHRCRLLRKGLISPALDQFD